MSFGKISGNLTLAIRERLYDSFLRKHIGWFDDRDNSPGVLTGILSSEVQLLNGVSNEGVAVILEANFAIITGLTIAFYYCW